MSQKSAKKAAKKKQTRKANESQGSPGWTRQEAASAAGVSLVNFDRWRPEPVGKVGRSVLFDPKEVLRAYAEYQQKRSNDENLDLQKERAILARNQARKVAIETEVLEGNLLPADQVESAWAEICYNFRSRLLSMPPRLAAIVRTARTDEESEGMIRDAVHEALDELSKYSPPDPEYNPESSPGDSTTTSADSEPVGRRRKKAVKRKQR